MLQLSDIIKRRRYRGTTEKMVFSGIAYTTIEGRKKVDRLTNESYDVAARKADKRIEENNREYAATYKRAALFFAK